MSKLSKKKVIEALEKNSGMPTQAAKQLGVTYQGLWNYIQRNPELKQVQDLEREKAFYDAEQFLTFAYKTGYIQTSELDQNGRPTKEVLFESVDYRTRIETAKAIMSQHKGAVGIKEEIDVTSKGEKVNSQSITVIELPEALRPKPTTQETSESRE